MTIKLGDKVKDAYTGFIGIAVARTEWLYGCARITIAPDKTDKDGKIMDSATFDEPQVQLVKTRVPIDTTKKPKSARKPGGPQSPPARGR